MDQVLIATAKLFTPPISNRRKKKTKDGKSNSGISADSGKMAMKSKTQLTQYRNTNPLLSSDESEPEVGLPPVYSGDMNDWITDDESEKPKSTTTSKTSASYITCLTNQITQRTQRYEVEISDDDDEDANEITAVYRVQSQEAVVYEITDDESESSPVPAEAKSESTTPKIHEYSSSEKVQIWLTKIERPEPKSAPKPQKSAQSQPLPGSQTSSSGYPITLLTGRSSFSSLAATSRQESSPEEQDPSRKQSNTFWSSRPRNSSVSQAVNSQATSSSRSSSFCFKDRPPWSQNGPTQKSKKKKQLLPPKYSDATEWSDAKSTLESTEESMRLYIETSEEQNENIYQQFTMDNGKQNEVPERRYSKGTTCTSKADTVPKMSEIFSSSEEFNCRPLPLHDLTNNFNPVLSSTHSDSVFSFPSYDTDEKEAKNKSLRNQTPTKNNSAVEEDSPEMEAVRRRPLINISSDEETHFETGGEQIIPETDDSDEDEESPQRQIRRPTRASYIELVSSESETEDNLENTKEGVHEIPETEDDEEEEDLENQETERKQPRRLNFSTQDSGEDKSEEEEELVENSQSPRNSSSDNFPVKPSPHRAVAPILLPVEKQRRRYISSDSEEDDFDKLDQFFKKHKANKKSLEEEEVLKDANDDSFVVDDDVIELDSDADADDEEVQKDFSPSFYLRVINERRKNDKQIDLSIQGGLEVRKQFTQLQISTPTKAPTPKYTSRTDPRPQTRTKFVEKADYSPCLGFLASLSSVNHHRCDPEAVPYLKKFNAKKDDLVEHLFALFNKTVFNNELDSEMSITWNNRLRSTAGFCYNQRKKISAEDTIRISRIELSGKILTNAAQLRDTLIHEMCHAATWVIDGTLGGHGPGWKKWTRKAMKKHPELPEIKRCHGYTIQTKFTYKCTKCTYSFGRHSKSLDMERKVCGICRGRFELIVNTSKGASSSATPRKPTAFALFVKENYKIVRQKNMAHKEAMQVLGQKFKEAKIQNA